MNQTCLYACVEGMFSKNKPGRHWKTVETKSEVYVSVLIEIFFAQTHLACEGN